MSGLRIAVVGATGQVGGVLLDLLEQRPFWEGDRIGEVVAFASERSAGKTIRAGGGFAQSAHPLRSGRRQLPGRTGRLRPGWSCSP